MTAIQERSTDTLSNNELRSEIQGPESAWETSWKSEYFAFSLRQRGALHEDDQSIHLAVDATHPNRLGELGFVVAAGTIASKARLTRRGLIQTSVITGLTGASLLAAKNAGILFAETPPPQIPTPVLEEGLAPEIQQAVSSFLQQPSTQEILKTLAKKDPAIKVYGVYDAGERAPRALVDRSGQLSVISVDGKQYDLPQIPGYLYSVDIKTGDITKAENKKVNSEPTGTAVVHEITPTPAKVTVTVTHTATRTPVATVEFTATPTATATKTNKLYTAFIPAIGAGKEGLYNYPVTTLLSTKDNGAISVEEIKQSFANDAPYGTGNHTEKIINRTSSVEPLALKLPNGVKIVGYAQVKYDGHSPHPYASMIKVESADGKITELMVQPDTVREAYEQRLTYVPLQNGNFVVLSIFAAGNNGEIGIQPFLVGRNSINRLQYIPAQLTRQDTARTPQWLSQGPIQLSGTDPNTQRLTAIIPDQSGSALNMLSVDIDTAIGKVSLASDARPFSISESSQRRLTKIEYIGYTDKGHMIAGVSGFGSEARLDLYQVNPTGTRALTEVIGFSGEEIAATIRQRMKDKYPNNQWTLEKPKATKLKTLLGFEPGNNKFTGWMRGIIENDGNKVNKYYIYNVIIPVYDNYGNMVLAYFKYSTASNIKTISVFDPTDKIDPFYVDPESGLTFDEIKQLLEATPTVN